MRTDPTSQRRRILIVEDDADGREALRTLLVSWGHEVSVAENGAQGVRLTLDGHPEIVFIDIGMPDMDGYEVARRIRAANGNGDGDGHPRLIAFTGWTRPEDARRSHAAGFADHIAKPVHPEALQAFIAALPK